MNTVYVQLRSRVPSSFLKRNFSNSAKCLAAEKGNSVSSRANWEHNGERKLASMKRGPGGRSSVSGSTTTVFGASGFIGRYVVNTLGRTGNQVIVPFRGEQYWVRDLKLMGDLGQINFVPFHAHDEDSIRKSMLYSDTVINLIGAETDTKCFTMNDVNVNTARNIARIARQSGVKRLVHISAMNASENPPKILLKEGSKFLATKAQGEDAVRNEFPDATIVRPADVYGEEDRFLHYYRFASRRMLRAMPLWKKGMETIKQPIYVGDLGRGIVAAATAPDTEGKVFEGVGPHRYYLGDMVDYIYSLLRWFDGIDKIPITPMFKWQIEALSLIPTQSFPFSLDRLEREHITDELTGVATLEDLGVKLARIEDRWPWHLRPYRQYNYYQQVVGTFPEPQLPPIVAPSSQ